MVLLVIRLECSGHGVNCDMKKDGRMHNISTRKHGSMLGVCSQYRLALLFNILPILLSAIPSRHGLFLT